MKKKCANPTVRVVGAAGLVRQTADPFCYILFSVLFFPAVMFEVLDMLV